MAKLNLEGFDDLLQDLGALDFDKVAPQMLAAGSPVLQSSLILRSASHKESGDMVRSIKATKAKAWRSGGGWSITVRPTGKDRKGVRNMEKMCYLEYGTKNQPATPVLTPAVKASEDPVNRRMQEVFDRYTKGLEI